jgi:hypothetical protein
MEKVVTHFKPFKPYFYFIFLAQEGPFWIDHNLNGFKFEFQICLNYFWLRFDPADRHCGPNPRCQSLFSLPCFNGRTGLRPVPCTASVARPRRGHATVGQAPQRCTGLVVAGPDPHPFSCRGYKGRCSSPPPSIFFPCTSFFTPSSRQGPFSSPSPLVWAGWLERHRRHRCLSVSRTSEPFSVGWTCPSPPPHQPCAAGSPRDDHRPEASPPPHRRRSPSVSLTAAFLVQRIPLGPLLLSPPVASPITGRWAPTDCAALSALGAVTSSCARRFLAHHYSSVFDFFRNLFQL